ncbi:MAG TPA: hypothetical protein VFO86_05785, partial [Terriglobia bacterium]|nr:hypothetical protein [Terriglobia bacterium]
EFQCIEDVCSPSREILTGAPAIKSVSPNRDTIELRLPNTECRIELQGISNTYEVTSIISGNVNLGQFPIRVDNALTQEIVVNLHLRK